MNILLAGDSTVADYPESQRPMTGWGQALRELFAPENVVVKNFAKPGATTKTFMEEGLWDDLRNAITPGDLVLIQFGHNDQKPENGVLPGEYESRLRKMITDVKTAKGQAILCSPTERRLHPFSHKPEPSFTQQLPLLRRIAETEEIPLYDLNRYTYFLYQTTGIEEAKRYFLWSGVGELANYPAGSQDNTHFSEAGALAIARYVKLRLREFIQSELFDKRYYGACMYPEVWPEEVFAQDVAQMKELGMNFARIGEFIWQHIEKTPGQFDLSVLERALTLYQQAGIDVCLCIPTPTPPRWFTVMHPEARIKNLDGTVMEHGSRQQCCTNNEDYRFYAYRMTREVAKLARRFDNVIAIQLDNEFKCHVDLCFCDTCQNRWHQYLAEEYGTVQWLNKSWGTQVWSETYDRFDQVVMPLTTPFLHNSSLMNAFRKFTADTINEFAHDLCHFVRMETEVPITHNTAFGFNLMNDRLFRDLDVAGFDTYPKYTDYPWYTMNLDRFRNVRNTNQEMLLLETCTSHNGHIENYATPAPTGWVTAEAFIGYAGNLKSFSFWHYRGHRFGVEQPHSAVVTAWGEPDQGFEDVQRTGKLLQEMEPYLQRTHYQKANVAIVYSDQAKRFYTIDNGGIYDYRSLFLDYYGSVIRGGINVEIIQENSDFTDYEVLLIPYLRNVSPELLEKLQVFTKNGGKLILGPMTGDRTGELSWPANNGLDLIGEWLHCKGITQYRVEEGTYTASYQGKTTTLSGLVTTFAGDNWQAVVEGAKQQLVIGKQQVDAGEVFYVGGQPQKLTGDELWRKFLTQEVLPYETDRGLVKVKEGIMKYRRESQTEIQLYLCNLGVTESSFELKTMARSCLNHEDLFPGEVTLAPYEYLILSFAK